MTASPREDSAPKPTAWKIRAGQLVLRRPIVVGILNVTPDSFSDGGRFASSEAAMVRAVQMVDDGADLIDIGGESTRPQAATAVPVDEELRRVIPVVREVRRRFPDLPISVDTIKSDVADSAIAEGANIINDVSAFRLDPRMREIAAATGAGVVLMHSRGTVETMGTYQDARYGADVVADVAAELHDALNAAVESGIARESIVLDPGIGFAKQSIHSLTLLHSLDRLLALGFPLMVGVSRKRFIGELSRVAQPSDRVAGTIGANVVALMCGARLFRVHDVAVNRQALDVAWGILTAGHGEPAERSDREPDGSGSRFPVPRSQGS